MTDKTDLIREIHEYVTAHGGENTATHLLVQAASAIQTQAAELEAVGAGGVQALSAAPAGWKLVPENATDAMVFAGCTVDNATHMKIENSILKTKVWAAMLEAAPKAAPGELHDHQILAITTAYEQGVGKGRQAHESGKEIANPYGTGYRCDLAWQYGYKEGKEQAERIAKAAPTPPAEQQAQPGAVGRTGCTAGTDEECTRRGCATTCPALQAAPKAAPESFLDGADVQDESGVLAYYSREAVLACITAALESVAAPKAAPGEREQAAQRLRELAGISQDDVADPLHPRYIEGYKAGHAAGRKRAAHAVPGVQWQCGQQASGFAAPQQEAQEPVWDGKLSDAMQNALDALYLECGPGITRDITHQVQKECEAIYTSYTTTKRMYQAARDRLELLEAAQPQPDPFAAPRPAPAPLSDPRITAIEQAIRDYHYALDCRKHGGVAEVQAFGAICNAMKMDWVQGQESERRAALAAQGGE